MPGPGAPSAVPAKSRSSRPILPPGKSPTSRMAFRRPGVRLNRAARSEGACMPDSLSPSPTRTSTSTCTAAWLPNQRDPFHRLARSDPRRSTGVVRDESNRRRNTSQDRPGFRSPSSTISRDPARQAHPAALGTPTTPAVRPPHPCRRVQPSNSRQLRPLEAQRARTSPTNLLTPLRHDREPE